MMHSLRRRKESPIVNSIPVYYGGHVLAELEHPFETMLQVTAQFLPENNNGE